VRPVRAEPTTLVQPFKLSSEEDDTSNLSLVHVVPSFDNPFRPHSEPRVTELKPFSFEPRTQQIRDKRERLILRAIEAEQKVLKLQLLMW